MLSFVCVWFCRCMRDNTSPLLICVIVKTSKKAKTTFPMPFLATDSHNRKMPLVIWIEHGQRQKLCYQLGREPCSEFLQGGSLWQQYLVLYHPCYHGDTVYYVYMMLLQSFGLCWSCIIKFYLGIIFNLTTTQITWWLNITSSLNEVLFGLIFLSFGRI